MFDRHGVPKSRIDVLKQVPMFHGLPDKALARIDSHVDEVDVPVGRALTVEGQSSHEAFIVADGVAEVSVGHEEVRKTEIGEMIGELGILRRTARTATVTATTPMRLLVLNPRDLDWLFEDQRLAARVQENVDRHLAGPQPQAPEPAQPPD